MGAVILKQLSALGVMRVSRGMLGMLGIIGLSAISSPSLQAQLRLPEITMATTGMRSLTPAEAWFHVGAKSAQLRDAVSYRDAFLPHDSVDRVVAADAAQWLSRLQAQSAHGIQVDPAGSVAVAAHHDAEAQQQIAQRLATPGLSVQDRAYTLLTAVRAFASWRHPERLPIAEGYITTLAALGPEAAPWTFEARSAIQEAYYLLGRSADVIRHGTTAFALLPTMHYVDQDRSQIPIQPVYDHTVEALTGYPNGRAQIATLNATFRATIPAPAALVALDSGILWMERGRRNYIERTISTAGLLGTVGKPWIANYWVNRPTHDSASIALNDGKIRVVEGTYSYGCDGCSMALFQLQRLKQQFPHIEVMALTWTMGYWANRLVEPDEEAHLLEDFFLHRMKTTIPVGIFKCPKVLHEDGGTTAEAWCGPNEANYPNPGGKPIIWVFDGNGRVRRIYLGAGQDMEESVGQTIAFLTREANTNMRASN